MYLTDSDIRIIDDTVNRVIRLSEKVTELRKKLTAKEITLKGVREELAKDSIVVGITDDLAFEEDGTPCYSYLFGRALGALTGIQGQIEFAKGRKNGIAS